jgi:hypothetical protein
VPLLPPAAACENESACICKGATLADSVECPATDLLRWHGLHALSSAGLDPSRFPELLELYPVHAWTARNSTGTVRALLQSYRL